jgi:deazaflavin-dependent oxidoreductase (nitroreductase family)
MGGSSPGWAGEDFCYVTTTGRRTGRPHTIEIWFGANGQTVYLLAGNPGSDWVRNVRSHPEVSIRIGGEHREGRGRVVVDPDEEAEVRRLLASKYQSWREGRPLSEWARTALPVAIDLD